MAVDAALESCITCVCRQLPHGRSIQSTYDAELLQSPLGVLCTDNHSDYGQCQEKDEAVDSMKVARVLTMHDGEFSLAAPTPESVRGSG